MILRILFLKCPRCAKASIAAGLFKTKASCPACGHVFEKEAGYWVGAIYPFYVLTALVALALMLFSIFGAGTSVNLGFLLASIGALAASPYLFLVSRCFYINMEEKFFSRLGK